jgi:MFS family permease
MPTIFQTFAALMIAAVATGSSYTFGIYSSALKTSFGLTQPQLETISISCFCVGFVTFVPGLIGDKLGPRRTILLGGLLQSTSFLLFWALATHRIPIPAAGNGDNAITVLLLSATSITQFLGSSCVTGAVFATGVRSFPSQRGLLTGLIKGWVGLCGGLLTQIFVGVVPVDLSDKDDPRWLDFCLVAACCCFMATAVPSQFISVHDDDLLGDGGASERGKAFEARVVRRVRVGYGILLLMGCSVVASALSEDKVPRGVTTALAVAIVLIWLSPVVLAMDGLDGWGKEECGQEELPLVLAGEKGEGGDEGEVRNLTLREMVVTADFWLFLWPCVVLIGAGISVTTNASQMFSSVGSNQSATAITLFSAMQSLSRVVCGGLLDVLKKKDVERCSVVGGALIVMLCGYALFVWNTGWSLFVGVLFAGVGFGAAWPTMVVVVSELFGTKSLGGNYMVYDGCASAVGALVFGKFIPESVYEGGGDGGEGSGEDCVGVECFRRSYVIVAGLLASAVVCTGCLIARRKRERGERERGGGRETTNQ